MFQNVFSEGFSSRMGGSMTAELYLKIKTTLLNIKHNKLHHNLEHIYGKENY